MSPITIRPVRDTDINFILSTWLREYKQSDICRRMRDREYFDSYEPMIKEVLARSSPLIACFSSDEDVIAGYLVREYQSDANCIHFAFTKDSLRKMGIFKSLIKEANFTGGVYFTHWTSPVNSLINKYDFIYNPWRINVRFQDQRR